MSLAGCEIDAELIENEQSRKEFSKNSQTGELTLRVDENFNDAVIVIYALDQSRTKTNDSFRVGLDVVFEVE